MNHKAKDSKWLMNICFMKENLILFEEENQVEVNISDACGLVVSFWWEKDIWVYTVASLFLGGQKSTV